MRETTKCYQARLQRGDFDKFLKGDGIDIGAGPDPLHVPSGTVRAWDVKDGDAQKMAGVPDNAYDFVYSSHCLEHMRDVPEALTNWVRILRPGGWLYVVIPDYILYEKMTWPSRFNADHKQSFSNVITRSAVVRPNHWHVDQDLIPLLKGLGLEEVQWAVEFRGFNFNAGYMDQTLFEAVAQIYFVARKRTTNAGGPSA
jgi:SAM-dependent methyltransferase